MNAILSEAIESYRFNNDLLDAIINDIPMSPAMEEAGQTGTPSTSNNANASTTTTNTTGDDKNNEANKEGGNAGAALIEKIKKLFEFLHEVITKAITNLKGKLQYAITSKRAYDQEMRELEKKYKPRFDLVKKNRKYDSSILPKLIVSLDRAYTEYTTDLSTVVDTYKKVTDGNIDAEQYNTKVTEITNKDIHKNVAQYVARDLGTEFNKIETFPQLTKAVQQKHRGMTVNIGASDDNAEAPKGEGSVEMRLDQNVYNDAKKFIMDFNNRVTNCHRMLDKMNTYQNTVKNTVTSIAHSQNEATKASATAVLKMGKNLNFFSTMINFVVSAYVEQLVNARMVVKTCHGASVPAKNRNQFVDDTKDYIADTPNRTVKRVKKQAKRVGGSIKRGAIRTVNKGRRLIGKDDIPLARREESVGVSAPKISDINKGRIRS